MEAREGLGQGGGQLEENNKKEVAESEREIRYEKKKTKNCVARRTKRSYCTTTGSLLLQS